MCFRFHNFPLSWNVTEHAELGPLHGPRSITPYAQSWKKEKKVLGKAGEGIPLNLSCACPGCAAFCCSCCFWELIDVVVHAQPALYPWVYTNKFWKENFNFLYHLNCDGGTLLDRPLWTLVGPFSPKCLCPLRPPVHATLCAPCLHDSNSVKALGSHDGIPGPLTLE